MKFRIKTGSGVPESNQLEDGQIGFDSENKKLYVKSGLTVEEIGKHDHDWSNFITRSEIPCIRTTEFFDEENWEELKDSFVETFKMPYCYHLALDITIKNSILINLYIADLTEFLRFVISNSRIYDPGSPDHLKLIPHGKTHEQIMNLSDIELCEILDNYFDDEDEVEKWENYGEGSSGYIFGTYYNVKTKTTMSIPIMPVDSPNVKYCMDIVNSLSENNYNDYEIELTNPDGSPQKYKGKQLYRRVIQCSNQGSFSSPVFNQANPDNPNLTLATLFEIHNKGLDDYSIDRIINSNLSEFIYKSQLLCNRINVSASLGSGAPEEEEEEEEYLFHIITTPLVFDKNKIFLDNTGELLGFGGLMLALFAMAGGFINPTSINIEYGKPKPDSRYLTIDYTKIDD